jgi:hypothetical protein
VTVHIFKVIFLPVFISKSFGFLMEGVCTSPPFRGIAVPNSRYTAIPVPEITMAATQMKRARPTLPLRDRIVLGVAKIPVPTIRLKIKNTALTRPICRRSSVVVYTTSSSAAFLSIRTYSEKGEGEKELTDKVVALELAVLVAVSVRQRRHFSSSVKKLPNKKTNRLTAVPVQFPRLRSE